MLPDGISVNSDNFVVSLKLQLETVEILFNLCEEEYLKANSNISLNIMKKGYVSIIKYSFKHLNPMVSDPRQFWKLLHDQRNTQTLFQHFEGFSAKCVW